MAMSDRKSFPMVAFQPIYNYICILILSKYISDLSHLTYGFLSFSVFGIYIIMGISDDNHIFLITLCVCVYVRACVRACVCVYANLTIGMLLNILIRYVFAVKMPENVRNI